MSVILPGKNQNKSYHKEKLISKLMHTYDSIIPSIKEMRLMAKDAGVDEEKLKGAFMIIAHGFDQAQWIIDGKEIDDSEARKHVEEQRRKGDKDGRSTR